MNMPLTVKPDIGTDAIKPSSKDKLPLHVAIFLADGTILSDETFRLESFSGQEHINSPFQFQLELHANTDALHGSFSYEFSDILSRSVTVGIRLPGAADGAFSRAVSGGSEEHLALWNGIVADFSMAGPGIYQLSMKPALWKLSLTNRYCIHQQLNISGAIEKVLADHGMTAKGAGNQVSVAGISGADNTAACRIQDWLQAGESDLDFINRLTQKAHIYFYFEHHATYHRLVFANRPAYPPVLPGGRKLRYNFSNAQTLGLDQDDLITDYRYAQTMTATGVSGVLARQQAAWEQDTVATFSTYRAQSDSQLGPLPFRRFKMCQYGGSDGEVRWDTDTCDQTRETAGSSLSGSSTCPMMRPAYYFGLDQAADPAVNPYPVRPSLDGRNFVLTQVQHKAELNGGYSNQFQATESYGQIAPFSVSDTQQGVVLAQVVKHDNGTNPKDWRYYQRSAFDPETDKVTDSAASPSVLRPQGVYVRFATDPPDAPPVWVKLAPHMQTAPELLVTVLVSRANDHSELPEIQSIVQNNGRTTVTPSRWMANTAVGNNYSTSYGDGCSVRFGKNSPGNLPPAKAWVDDKYQQGNSEVAGWFSGVHLRDVSWSKGGSSSYSTAEKGRSDVLSESISIGSVYNKQDATHSKSISNVDHSWSQSTGIDSYSHSTMGESTRFDKVGTAKSTSITGSSDSTSTTGVANSVATTGVADSVSTTGMSTRMDTTGISMATGITGLSKRVDITGQSSGLGITGQSDSVSMTGVSNRVGVTGTENSVSVTGSSNSTSAVGSSVSNSDVGSSTSTSNIGSRTDTTTIGTSDSTTNIGSSTSSQKTGFSTNTSVSGISIGASLAGMSSNSSATGISNNNSAVGASVDLSAAGMTTRLSAVGAQMELSAIGDQTQISLVGGALQVSLYGSCIQVQEGVTQISLKELASEIPIFRIFL